MNISDQGVKLIMQREGHKNRAYRDSRGLWTIGVGHLLPQTAMSRVLDWTDEKVMAVLKLDLQRFVACVVRVIKRPMKQSQLDALVSLAFNIGEHGFTGSSVVKSFNKGNVQEAAKDFLMWEHPPELRQRRESEMKQFLS